MIRSSRATRPGSGPSVWIPTPPRPRNPQTHSSSSSPPFGYTSLRASSPCPASARQQDYTIDYSESKDVGRATSRAEPPSSLLLRCSGRHRQGALWSANVRSLASSMDL